MKYFEFNSVREQMKPFMSDSEDEIIKAFANIFSKLNVSFEDARSVLELSEEGYKAGRRDWFPSWDQFKMDRNAIRISYC